MQGILYSENILLVHFNSVSHLHKLKKVLKEQQESPALLTPQSEKGSPNPSTSQPGSTLLAALGSLNAKKQLEFDDEVKLYILKDGRSALLLGRLGVIPKKNFVSHLEISGKNCLQSFHRI